MVSTWHMMFLSCLFHQVRIQDLCKGAKEDLAGIAQRSCGGGKHLGLKIESRGKGPGRGGTCPYTGGGGVILVTGL